MLVLSDLLVRKLNKFEEIKGFDKTRGYEGLF
jgi:hypothetical protein